MAQVGERQSVPYSGLAFLYGFCCHLFPDFVAGGVGSFVLSPGLTAGTACLADLEKQETMRV